jgi:hypothetical protein
MSVLFSTAYLPPLSYLQKCMSDKIVFESHEHFVKQTYRNRCNIAGPNGKQTLVIPVIHENLSTIPISEVKISNESPWNKIHWKSVTSAYRNAPYFEYYEDDFRELFMNPGEKLFDFNLRLLKMLFSFFKISPEISFTNEFEKSVAYEDMRNQIHPKKNSILTPVYHQVFEDRNGFIPDLSVIDYLFNEGNKLTDS